jgi:glycosyltransferase involved in cell wall biosynthesis
MPPARVLFLVNTLQTGGFERDVGTLCEHIDRTRFCPEVWVLHAGGRYEDVVLRSRSRLRCLDRGWSKNPLFAWKAAREISHSEAALIHAFLPTIGTYAAWARMWFGVRQPMVLSIGQSYVSLNDRWMFHCCSRAFDWLVANSRSAARLGRSLGFSPQRTSVIHNGHPLDRFYRTIDRQQVRASLGVQSDEHMLLCVGRLVDTKRVCDVIAAAKLLRERLPVKLIVAGDGPERRILEEQVRTLQLDQSVLIAGNRNDVTDLLLAADLFVFPSETEGLPNALIEACLAGLPVVACQVSGVNDVVRHGETALLVPPRSPVELAVAVRRLLSHPDEAGRLAAAAQKHAQATYSIEQSLNALYDVYERLLDPRNGGAKLSPGLCSSGYTASGFSETVLSRSGLRS